MKQPAIHRAHAVVVVVIRVIATKASTQSTEAFHILQRSFLWVQNTTYLSRLKTKRLYLSCELRVFCQNKMSVDVGGRCDSTQV